MESLTEDTVVKNRRNGSVEAGIAHLIEAVEVLRRHGIEPQTSYSQEFFSTIKKYLS